MLTIKGKIPFLILAAAIAAADLYSKAWAFRYVAESGVTTNFHGDEKAVEVIDGFFYLTRVYNTGGIWGIAQEGVLSKVLVFVRILAVPGILYLLLRTSAKDKLFLTSLALFCAGAAGNLYDNLLSDNRGVRDFLDFFLDGRGGWHWPTFNIADSGIVCGVGLLMMDLLFSKRHAPQAAPANS